MLLILRFCLISSLSLQIILAKYLRGDINIGFESAISTNVTIDLDEKIDIEDWLHSLGYTLDRKSKVHSGSYNTVKFYQDEKKNNKIVLRESIEPIYGADKVWFNKEINQTHLLSTIGVAPYLYKAGYNYKNQGYMISERSANFNHYITLPLPLLPLSSGTITHYTNLQSIESIGNYFIDMKLNYDTNYILYYKK